MSCGILADAFRRLRQVKGTDQAISTKPVVLLFISFGAYGIAQILLLTQTFQALRKPYYYFVEFDHISFIAASVTFTMITHELIVKQTSLKEQSSQHQSS